MDHIAIMKKSWKLLEKVLDQTKVAESRWYKSKQRPWDKIQAGDNLYFKNSGEPATVKARVTKVQQYQIPNNKRAWEIMKKYGKKDLGTNQISSEIKNYIRNKKYAIIIYFDSVKKIKPLEIDKTGFGAMSAWITVKNINSIIKT